ncbi:LOW QUALITY PROTEIN: uncharacterized protein LOC124355994 [Homalodisca vitripennis]|uniref:LOW QUALITY PROTEIN: uncharacterized protein LOC124355994 n=1 Tax=Homalodisca vitripennis TaxID=197043 RepID=UPI001EEB33FE|nr:LOW QUALITY PROTEIN: uncharacterized protein LOC124355994 [Homalodisca vitripennis]
MKLLLLSALVAVALSHPLEVSEEDHAQWELFKTNLQFVREHNEKFENGEVTFDVEINKYSDLTTEEFVTMMNGYKRQRDLRGNEDAFDDSENVKLPKKLDWRKKGAVTEVKNQGYCGSCWAFSATGSLEGQHYLKTKKLVSLSEQNLIDCSTAEGNSGCRGGLMNMSFSYVQKNKGIDTEASYPYEAKNGTCRYNPKNKGATDNGYVEITSGSEKALQKAVATIGPISVAIDASHISFTHYKSGIIDFQECTKIPTALLIYIGHAVLAIGYGSTKKGGDYWLVKNSYGSDWGMNGYFMIARNHNNMCGIATAASYPKIHGIPEEKTEDVVSVVKEVGKALDMPITDSNQPAAIIAKPHLEYCSTVWSPHQEFLIDDMERIQRRLLHLVGLKLGFGYRDAPLNGIAALLGLMTVSMKVLLLSALVAVALSHPLEVSEEDHAQWELFKVAHEREYDTPEEELKRKNIFLENLQFVREHNEKFENGEVTFDVEINKYSDLTTKEFVTMMNGYKRPEGHQRPGDAFDDSENVRLPKNVDWRKKGAVTKVKNQGFCGACWAFSATGSLEGQQYLKSKKLVSLSEQNLVDCSTAEGNSGCHGGFMNRAFSYVQKNNGIDTEASYPYEGNSGTCRYNPKNNGATDNGYVIITSGSEKALQKAVATIGPISVAIDDEDVAFQHYKSGKFILQGDCSSIYLNHAVLAVGYGSAKNGGDYWLVKNSWGRNWGMNGYIMMARNQNNMCGIATMASYPKV